MTKKIFNLKTKSYLRFLCKQQHSSYLLSCSTGTQNKRKKKKVLFVSSGRHKTGINPIIKNQGESLQKENIEIDYFPIKGKGIRGYLKSILSLRSYLQKNNYDVVHAHYWLSAIVASFAGAKPMLVSLMGDDVKANAWSKWIIYLFSYLSWSNVIVKSQDMYDTLGLKKAIIIPNGVNLKCFRNIKKEEALNKVSWDKTKKHVLFTSDPKRVEKNFELTKEAFTLLDDKNVELHYLKDIPNEEIPFHYNAASVVILTSLWEGSPNAIKEAMACSVPIVATDVGDIRQIISTTDACYLCDFDAIQIASKLKEALLFEGKTEGKKAIEHLSSEHIAKKIIEIYNDTKGK